MHDPCLSRAMLPSGRSDTARAGLLDQQPVAVRLSKNFAFPPFRRYNHNVVITWLMTVVQGSVRYKDDGSSVASEDLVVEHERRRRPHTARCASSMPISAVRSTDVFDELYRRAPRLSRRLFGRHGGQVSRPRLALLLGGSGYEGWTCGLAKPEVGAPSGWRVRRTSSEPHLRGAKLKGHARNRWFGDCPFP